MCEREIDIDASFSMIFNLNILLFIMHFPIDCIITSTLSLLWRMSSPQIHSFIKHWQTSTLAQWLAWKVSEFDMVDDVKCPVNPVNCDQSPESDIKDGWCHTVCFGFYPRSCQAHIVQSDKQQFQRIEKNRTVCTWL